VNSSVFACLEANVSHVHVKMYHGKQMYHTFPYQSDGFCCGSRKACRKWWFNRKFSATKKVQLKPCS